MECLPLLLQLWIHMNLLVHVTTLLTFPAGKFNAARGKPTQHSSNYAPYGSSRAVDGNDGSHLGTCTHTQFTPHTWWGVNLQDVYTVDSVTLTNRDAIEHRLSNFTIYGSSTNINPTRTTDLVICNTQLDHNTMGASETRTFSCGHNPIQAQYIIVNKYRTLNYWQPLTICEVQVEADCLDGRYGDNCAGKCGNCKEGTTCRKDNGHCSACAPGYLGDFCTTGCSYGLYGDNCAYVCGNCKEGTTCSKDNGHCPSCASGYEGDKCTTECSDGRYGENCALVCGHCKKGTTCRKDNGHCSPCDPGYEGSQCKAECSDGSYGDNCAYACGRCKEATCSKDNGYCTACDPGYEGDQCQIECVDGRYGENCGNICGHCKEGTPCRKDNGQCSACALGYEHDEGIQCKTECSDGRYGDNCAYACGYCKNGTTCRKENGSCSACAPGYKGIWCTTECVAGRYGENCANGCGHCKEGTTCRTDDGSCSACAPGYKGNLCKTAWDCVDNYYGYPCQPCPDNCLNRMCHDTGYCVDDKCEPGYLYGQWCDTECPLGTYGYNCSEPCSPTCAVAFQCDKVNGNCLDGCMLEYYGDYCTSKCVEGEACDVPNGLNSTSEEPVQTNIVAPIIGAVSAVILVIIIIILIIIVICVLRRRRRKRYPKEDNNNNKDNNQLVTNHIYPNTLLKIEVEHESVVETTKSNNKPEIKKKPDNKPTTKPVTLKNQINETKTCENDYIKPDAVPIVVAAVPKPVLPVKPSRLPKPASKPLSADGNDTRLYGNVVTTLTKTSSVTMVKSSEFAKYVSDTKLAEEPFSEEYEAIPVPMESWEKAKAANLKTKNRYKNVLPYDNNTVTLKQVGNDPVSTYINASFIKDYFGQKAYIAALGTTEHTLADFWRMIWEYDITLIVMVTKLIEEGKTKCIQYWPDKGSVKYGDISITLESCNSHRTYTIRMFKVEKNGEVRSITHYNYTAWPDKGVPESVPSIVHIRDIMKKYKTQNKDKPVLVHCSAGVGRTGTVIALDILLDQAEKEHQVDVRMCVSTLRKQRAYMVQTLVQYVFIHDALNEVLSVGFTMVPPQKLHSLLANEEELKTQYKFLEHMRPSLNADKMQLGNYEQDKNRDNQIIPTDKQRVKILSSPEVYFNGVYVEGYHSNTEYIATQTPLESTASDFWRMIYEEECKLVVCLQTDPDYKDWFATEKSSLQFDKLISTTTHIDEGDSVTKYDVTVSRHVETEDANTNTGDGNLELSLHIFVLNDSEKQTLSTKMNNLLKEVEKCKGKSERSIVLCLNGCTLTGQYIALSTLYDMVKREQQIDVFTVVKQMRKNRPQFIQTQDQYIFLHQTLMEIYSSSAEYKDLSATTKRNSIQMIL